jgi:hypothetical protein
MVVTGANMSAPEGISFAVSVLFLTPVLISLVFLLNCWMLDNTPIGKLNVALIEIAPGFSVIARRHWLMSWLSPLFLPRQFFEGADAKSVRAPHSASDSGLPLATATGQHGVVSLYEDRIQIARKGIASYILHGFDRTGAIHVEDVVSVDVEEAGPRKNGYVHFVTGAASQGWQGIYSAAFDPDSLVFRPKEAEQFKRLAAAVKERIARRSSEDPRRR